MARALPDGPDKLVSPESSLVRHNFVVAREAREARNGHRGMIVWITGYSGAGKSTLASALDARLFADGRQSFVLDGDNIRHGLNADLGFSQTDRSENIRRLGETAKLFSDAGPISIAAVISPFRKDRERVRILVGAERFCEVWCRCPLAICEERDPKGLYRRARAGGIADFTGISSPYEAPEHADVVVDTDRSSVEASVRVVLDHLEKRGVFRL